MSINDVGEDDREQLARCITAATVGWSMDERVQATTVIGLLLSGHYKPGRVGEFVVLTPKKRDVRCHHYEGVKCLHTAECSIGVKRVPCPFDEEEKA